MPPAFSVVVLLLTVLRVRNSVRVPVTLIPPPRLSAELPVMMLSVMVRLPPPKPSAVMPAPRSPMLFWTVTLASDSVASLLRMPPPLSLSVVPGLPFWMVRVLKVTFAPESRSNTRSMPAAAEAPAWMIVAPWPAPMIVTVPVMSRSPVAAASSYLPVMLSV